MTNLLTCSTIFVFITLAILTQQNASLLQPTRNVSIAVDNLNIGAINLYFVCPNVRSTDDIVRYYKIEGGIKGLIEKKKTFGIKLPIKSVSDLGQYECSVVSKDTTSRNATLNIMNSKNVESPTKFVYNHSQIMYVTQKSGSVELNCGAAADQMVTWYKPPQYHIHTGNKFPIETLTEFDYGTYYCAVGMTTKLILPVKKIILVPTELNEKEKKIDEDVTYYQNLIPKFQEIRFRPEDGAGNSDTLTWEQPPGTILLDHGRDFYIQSYTAAHTEFPFYYRINRNGDYLVNKVGKVFISESKETEIVVTVEGRASYGSEIKLNCFPSPVFGNDTKVTWKLGDKIVHQGNTYLIKNFQKDFSGKYSCEIQKGNSKIETRSINLAPEKDVQSKIEMTPDPGLYYNYHSGKKKELHCELSTTEGSWKGSSKDVIWTFEGRNINTSDKSSPFSNKKQYGILNMRSASILVLINLGEHNQGKYKCFQGKNVYAANLILEPSEITVELSPESQTVQDNVNSPTEMHCRIESTMTIYNSSLIKWSFKPESSEKEEPLPAEAKVERPELTSLTSFVSIENTLKRHEGIYICRVLDKKAIGTLIVKAKLVLTVNPKEITVKPGGDARFLCQLTGIDGKVTWRRRDRKSFELDKENRISGSTNTLLEIKQVKAADDGTIYECNYNAITEFVTLWVKDDCALNQRQCKNGTCIEESKFCNGKDDCGDNSDEDPKRCNECTPNSIHCDFLNNSIPNKRCVVKHWQCDGTDDCGNNFDELNCPVKNINKCIGSHFLCGNDTLIPRAYWCDGEADCKSMEDEEGCSAPQVIEPPKPSQITVIENTTLSMDCQISGRPIPTITWRFNWGYLPEKLDHNISEIVTNCSIITSTLRIKNISPDQSGIFTCEAIAKRRVMAPDISVTVTKASVCKRPFFSNDAWSPEFCLRCYCSNLTDDCTSAGGYITNPDLIESHVKSSDAAIINYKDDEYYEPARKFSFANETTKMYLINKNDYQKLVPDEDHFLGGSFNLRGSWIHRYGYPLTYKVLLSGESTGHFKGPIIVMKGHNDKKIYYCTAPSRIIAYASDDTYDNNIRIILWEQDRWFTTDDCTKSVSRSAFLELLKDVRAILFRVKYFKNQTDFKMSKITMQEAIKSKYEHSWVSRVEKCNCPEGYSGMSCEIKTK